MSTQKFFEWLGYDSFSALALEVECADIDLQTWRVDIHQENWSGYEGTPYQDRQPRSVYTLSWRFKDVDMKLEGTDIRKLVSMVIAAARAYQ